MPEATVLSLRQYVAMLDICIELPLVTMQTVLAFGPFNALLTAQNWASEVERIHRQIEIESQSVDDSVATFMLMGFTTQAFIDVRISNVDIVQTDMSGRNSQGLIHPSVAKEDAEGMHIHALKAFEGVIAQALGVARNETNG